MKLNLTYPGIRVQSTVMPDRAYSFNDLAATHARRGSEAMIERLKSMVNEINYNR